MGWNWLEYDEADIFRILINYMLLSLYMLI